jgi:hypothetical protein
LQLGRKCRQRKAQILLEYWLEGFQSTSFVQVDLVVTRGGPWSGSSGPWRNIGGGDVSSLAMLPPFLTFPVPLRHFPFFFVVHLAVSRTIIDEHVVDTLLPVALLVRQAFDKSLVVGTVPQGSKVGKNIGIDGGNVRDGLGDTLQIRKSVVCGFGWTGDEERVLHDFHHRDTLLDILLQHPA